MNATATETTTSCYACEWGLRSHQHTCQHRVRGGICTRCGASADPRQPSTLGECPGQQPAKDAAATTGDELATLMREALDAARQAGYRQGRYTAGAGDETAERAKLDAAHTAASEAATAMWRAFYDHASA